MKYGQRTDLTKSTYHQQAFSEFTASSRLCACCHDEQSPYGAWVKSTYREWKAGPYAEQGVRCQDCHMYYATGKSVGIGKEHPDLAHHNFHGSHVPGKLKGAVDVALYPSREKVTPGLTMRIEVSLFNGKAGHFIPSGST